MASLESQLSELEQLDITQGNARYLRSLLKFTVQHTGYGSNHQSDGALLDSWEECEITFPNTYGELYSALKTKYETGEGIIVRSKTPEEALEENAVYRRVKSAMEKIEIKYRGEGQKCEECGGTGKIIYSQGWYDGLNPSESQEFPCSSCNKG